MMWNTLDNILLTPRLKMVPFSREHLDDLSKMDSDSEVMRYIGDGSTRSVAETETAIERVQDRWKERGFSWWSVFIRENNAFIGAACVQRLANKDDAPLEVGWKLIPSAQGKGYATEAGSAAIGFAFENLRANRVVAVSHPENHLSHRVMERLQMNYVGIEEHYGHSCVVYELCKGNE